LGSGDLPENEMNSATFHGDIDKENNGNEDIEMKEADDIVENPQFFLRDENIEARLRDANPIVHPLLHRKKVKTSLTKASNGSLTEDELNDVSFHYWDNQEIDEEIKKYLDIEYNRIYKRYKVPSVKQKDITIEKVRSIRKDFIPKVAEAIIKANDLTFRKEILEVLENADGVIRRKHQKVVIKKEQSKATNKTEKVTINTNNKDINLLKEKDKSEDKRSPKNKIKEADEKTEEPEMIITSKESKEQNIQRAKKRFHDLSFSFY
jgi:hypothetical protein